MPYVAGKKFPYTKAGKAEAKAYAKKKKQGFLDRLSKGQKSLRKQLKY
tara:strand:- start:1 stop:144 length:144 start_codon:yes stop_codon:yes gene_type:complete